MELFSAFAGLSWDVFPGSSLTTGEYEFPGYMLYKLRFTRMFILEYKIILRAMNIIMYVYQGLQ